MSEGRGHWYLLTGALVGLVLGLIVAWWVAPVQSTASLPANLRTDFKDEYRYMIAASYAATGNLGRARARLALLADKDMIAALDAQAQRMTANNIAPSVVRNISSFSLALQKETPPTATEPPASQDVLPTITEEEEDTEEIVSSPTPVSVAVTETPLSISETATPEPIATAEATNTLIVVSTPTSTTAPRPTLIPTFTPGAAFNQVGAVRTCDATQPGLLQIILRDANNQPVAGVELTVTWAGGEEHFFTGLKPELGNGYADFSMSPNIEYALSLSNGATRVTLLKSLACSAKDGSSSFESLRLEFKQP